MTDEEIEKQCAALICTVARLLNDIEVFRDRVSNVEAFMVSFEKKFAELIEDMDISKEQWIEERLRALELQVKELRDGKG